MNSTLLVKEAIIVGVIVSLVFMFVNAQLVPIDFDGEPRGFNGWTQHRHFSQQQNIVVNEMANFYS